MAGARRAAAPAMLLAELVQASQAVAETRARSTKIELLAACIAKLLPDEAEIGVAFLSGEIRQGKIGLGYATIRGVAGGLPSESPTLALSDVDRALGEIAGIGGARSAARRSGALAALFGRATGPER